MLYEARHNSNEEEIAEKIGFTATCTLIAWYGGRKVWIPQVAKAEDEMARILGLPSYKALVAEYGSNHLVVPTDTFRDTARRDRVIYNLLRIGYGTRDIGAMVGLTQRAIQALRVRFEEIGLLCAEPCARTPAAIGAKVNTCEDSEGATLQP
jgi:hypothetical protein